MKVLLIDTETTGLISNGSLPLDKQPEIIEFYACEADLKTGEVNLEFSTYIEPKNEISSEITKITGISNKDVIGSGSFGVYADRIQELLDSTFISKFPVIAHNASFDKEMLDIEFARLNMKLAWPRIICTVEQTIHIKGYRLSLSELHETLFGVKFSGAHRAKDDVAALLKCCVELHKQGMI